MTIINTIVEQIISRNAEGVPTVNTVIVSVDVEHDAAGDEEYAYELLRLRVRHAGMEPDQRRKVQDLAEDLCSVGRDEVDALQCALLDVTE